VLTFIKKVYTLLGMKREIVAPSQESLRFSPESVVKNELLIGRSSGFPFFETFPPQLQAVVLFEIVHVRYERGFTATGIAPELHRIPY
jgi:hypothetical protein